MSESFAELFESSQVAAKMRPGTIVKGIVVAIRPDYVIINAGLKSEGNVPAEQFRNPKGEMEIAVGDEVIDASVRGKLAAMATALKN